MFLRSALVVTRGECRFVFTLLFMVDLLQWSSGEHS